MGTGLGLWITKELCELMKGDNKVSSIEGVGTSFVFLIKTWSFFDENQNTSKKKRQHLNTRLNYEIDPSNETRKDIAYQYRALSSLDCRRLKPNAFRRALIAEDLVYNQEIYKRMLKKEGIEVVIANDGPSKYSRSLLRVPSSSYCLISICQISTESQQVRRFGSMKLQIA